MIDKNITSYDCVSFGGEEYLPSDDELTNNLERFLHQGRASVTRVEEATNSGISMTRINSTVEHGCREVACLESICPHELYLLSIKGFLGVCASIVLNRSMEIGEPSLIYIDKRFDNNSELDINDCDLTVEWYPIDALAETRLRNLSDKVTVLKIGDLERLATAYFNRGDDSE
jgi:hypothetical protein